MFREQEIYEQNLKDKLTMDPVEKYQRYDRFPWKYIFQILLIIGTSYQVRVLTQFDSADARNLLFGINQSILGFTNFDYVYTADESPQMNFVTFSSVPEVADNINKLFDTIGTLDDMFFAKLNQTKINNTINEMFVYYRNPLNEQFYKQASYTFTVQDRFTEPFDLGDNRSIKDFLRRIIQFEINFGNIQFRTPDKDNLDIVESWTVKMKYVVTDLQQVTAQLDATVIESSIQRDDGSIPTYPFVYSYYWLIHLFILIISASSLVLHIKYIFDMVTLFTQSKFKSTRYNIRKDSSIMEEGEGDDWEQQYLNPEQDWMDQFDMRGNKRIAKIISQQKPWNKLTYDEKLLFIDSWVFITIIGNMLQSFTSIVLIFNLQTISLEALQLLIGFSCFFAWISICRYIEFEDNVYILTYLLKYSMPTLLRFMLGVLPFFIGYTILGLTLFYNVSYFSSFQRAFSSLICLSYGNMTYELAYYLGDNITSTVYVITYCVIFLIVFQNILMTIFVSMVYNKFDAAVKQEMLDFLQLKIPNLRRPIPLFLEQLIKSGSCKSDMVRYVHSARALSSKNSPHQSPKPLNVSNPSNESTVFQKNIFINDIKAKTKKIEKTLQKMQSDLNDDLKIFLITKRDDRNIVRQVNEHCLDFLLQKSTRLHRKCNKLREIVKAL